METLDDLLSSQDNEELVTVLLDGDIAAYRPAAATDGRMYMVKNDVGVWKYKKDVVEYCKKKDISIKDIELVFNPEPVQHAYAALKMQMQAIEIAIGGHHLRYTFETYLTTSGSNFRYDINPQYKANRVGKRKPFHLAACKEYLEKHYNAEYWKNLEADDCMAIRATELKAEDKPYVIVSIDKDLKQIEGHHFNWVKDEYKSVSAAQGRALLWLQVLMGDGTDNIYTPHSLGEKYALKWLSDVDWTHTTDEELMKICVECYTSKMKKALDHTDVQCWVEQTYDQVFLKRERL